MFLKSWVGAFVSFSRKAPVKDAAGPRNVSQQVTSHPGFARRVALEFNELKAKGHVADSPIRQLVLIKRAMRCVDEGIRRENSEGKCESIDDSIGWILGLIRAAEKVNLFHMKACAKACPCITEYVHPEDPEAPSKPGFWRFKGDLKSL